MTTEYDDWPPEPGPASHAHRFARAVLAVAEFVGPLLPAVLRHNVARWAHALVALVGIGARLFF